MEANVYNKDHNGTNRQPHKKKEREEETNMYLSGFFLDALPNIKGLNSTMKPLDTYMTLHPTKNNTSPVKMHAVTIHSIRLCFCVLL